MAGWALDLGTTNSGIACWDDSLGKPRLIELPGICRKPRPAVLAAQGPHPPPGQKRPPGSRSRGAAPEPDILVSALLPPQAMGKLFYKIQGLVADAKYVVGLHASERLEERGIMEWQAVLGLEDGQLIVERPHATPNPGRGSP
jgi:hypothetical protein